jgi:rhamnosyltransferase
VKICSLVTIYKPNTEEVKQNLKILLQYSDSIYLLFNSPVAAELQFDERIISIDNKKNIGISKAINKGVGQAAIDGYKYGILFDQDSYLTKANYLKMLNEFNEEEKSHQIACIGPSIISYNKVIKTPWHFINNKLPVKTSNIESVQNVITSGMLINTNIFLSLGGFDENYPVDNCDFLYCWKCIYNKYFVLQSKDAYISHIIGNNSKKIFGRNLHFHAPYRNYFMVRDTLNVCFKIKETPSYFRRLHNLFFLPWRMMLFLLLCNERGLRIKMYFWGLKDFLLNKHGFGSVAEILEATTKKE